MKKIFCYSNRDHATEVTPITLKIKLPRTVNISERMSALQNKQKTRKNILPFVAEYRPSVLYLKTIQMSKWHLIENQPLLREIYKDPSLLSYRKGRSLKDGVFVRANLKVIFFLSRSLVWPVILPSLYNCLFLRLITNHDNVILQFTTARIITNYDNRLLQFTIGTLLQFTTTAVITILDR